MNIETRIAAFSSLGKILRGSLAGKHTPYNDNVSSLIETQHLKNPWFTPDNVKLALLNIANELTEENLYKWTNAYPELRILHKPLNVGIIMAGNIPLVGFHDFLSVLISGNRVIAKPSSKDTDLIKLMTEMLISVNPDFSDMIRIEEGSLKGFDVVIATGSDNSSRYFEYYFGRYPNIIRKNRNSIAVITGEESQKELKALGHDVFSYYGLGCRNVSKIYVPVKYDFSPMIRNWDKYSYLINHSKYGSNYDYRKAVFLVNRGNFTDTGFILLREDEDLSSPVAVLHFEYYTDNKRIRESILSRQDKIQCIMGNDYLPFGMSQSPALWDYADGIDTLEFLIKKNIAGIM